MNVYLPEANLFVLFESATGMQGMDRPVAEQVLWATKPHSAKKKNIHIHYKYISVRFSW